VALLAADIGEAWSAKGNLQKSLEWFRTATEVLDFARGSAAGADETVAAKVDSGLGALHHRSGSVLPALESYRKALRVQTRTLHPSHPDLVSTRLSMAHARFDLGDAAGALSDIEAIEKTLREGPQEGLELGQTLILKSDILRFVNRTDVAEQAVREAIRLQVARLQGDEHPEIAVALTTYGSILHDSGKAEEAHEKYSKALEISTSTVGDKHPVTAAAHNSLGTLYEDLGDDGSAHEHFSRCLEIQLETVGKDSPDVASTYNNLATLLFRQGQRSEAVELLDQALLLLDQAGVPSDNPDRALYKENLGLILSKP